MIFRIGSLIAGILCFLFFFFPTSRLYGADNYKSYDQVVEYFRAGKQFSEGGENSLNQLEESCIKSYPMVAARKGRSLSVSLGKAPITFEDVGQSGNENFRFFRFAYYFPMLNLALVHKGELTWETFLLISNSNSVELMGPPIFSPDGKWAFSYLSCEMNGNWFDLVKIGKNLVSEEISWSSEDFRKMGFPDFEAPRWIATNSIEILTKSILINGIEHNSPMRTIISFDCKSQKWIKTTASDTTTISKDIE